MEEYWAAYSPPMVNFYNSFHVDIFRRPDFLKQQQQQQTNLNAFSFLFCSVPFAVYIQTLPSAPLRIILLYTVGTI